MYKNKSSIVAYLFLISIAVFMLVPLLYTISASFKSNAEILLGGANLLPKKMTLDNYVQAWRLANFDTYTFNSIRLSLTTTLGVVFFTSLAAYVFNRGEFWGKKVLYTIFLATMFVSAGSIMLYPILKLATAISLNNLTGVSIVQIFTAGAANLFLTIGYLKTIDIEVDEAATIDGCS
ncbi:MAG: carbohydrate ABC transporter permease, partial [Fibrobacter sp.]|nr:carbohydrate ABC transporter permease [Fibrobacter sp.]